MSFQQFINPFGGLFASMGGLSLYLVIQLALAVGHRKICDICIKFREEGGEAFCINGVQGGQNHSDQEQ